MVINMLANGEPVEKAVKYSSFSFAEVEKIKEEYERRRQ